MTKAVVNMKKVKYSLDPKSPLTLAAVCLFALSAVFRIVWLSAFTQAAQGRGVALHVLLPVSAAAAFIALLLWQGRDRLWLTFFPALAGVVFFIIKATGFTPVHQALCTVLYLGVAVLYGVAVLGLAPIRPLLIPLFGLPLLYHIFVEDLIQNLPTYTLAEWLQEWSVLAIMAGLLLTSLAMKRREPEN